MSMTQCVVPLAALTAGPYSLELGEAIVAKVKATNNYGASEYSD